ncbi:class I SAM-dependent methyltransferase [Paenibacillus abyssi]|uniref:Methyltransferase type 11 domain-containing protein n=1 Tax=Paenibacillus abyssi TaxID=1340531 RepID=A0A917CPT3_9BACL|nr:class I SAM-dependent methyltransferase [Paenibacillus abyssi]GGF93684.1 hypothetical protein GCM10010916_08770 [Paenibacillus abyssi]
MPYTLYQFTTGLLAAALSAAVLSIAYHSWKNGITPMPSSAPVRGKVADEINRIAGQGTLVEAGSGWGTLAQHLAKHCSGWRVVGIENSFIPLWVSRIAAKLDSRAGVTMIRADLYMYPYDSADVVVCYLYPGAMLRLSTIFRERLVPGTRVISICFALPGWEPERVIICGDLYRTKVYVYAV